MTGVLELLEADGIRPVDSRNPSAREYHAPCPVCGGKDRLVIQPYKLETGRIWCRQCKFSADGIGYLMKVHGMTFSEAAKRVGKVVHSLDRHPHGNRDGGPAAPPVNVTTSVREDAAEPIPRWRETGEQFVAWAADNLQKDPERLDQLHRERGISPETAKRWLLGWNPSPLKRPGMKWGIEGELIIPTGLVIPNVYNGNLVSIKVRREHGTPKYHIVRGSRVFPYVLPGDVTKTLMIVEGEFDALLAWEVAGDVLTPIAAGGCSNHPGPETLELITGAVVLLDCLDVDEAGENAGAWWRDWFPHSYRWRPTRKDPGEMNQAGEDVRRWIFAGIREALHEKGGWAGRLDFYEALDDLVQPFPPELLREYSEEEIERMAIMTEDGTPWERVEQYLRARN